MKQKTLDAANATKKAFLLLPEQELVFLLDWMLERMASTMFNEDLECELRELIGQHWDQEEEDWSKIDSAYLRREIKNQSTRDFAHGIGGIPFYAEIYEVSPVNNKEMLAATHKFAELIMKCASISEKPSLLIKTKIESIGLKG